MTAPSAHTPFAFSNRLLAIFRWLATRPGAAALLLLAVGLACYYPSLDGEFLWDDASLVQHNPASRSPALIGEIFRHHLIFDSPAAFYRPVQNLSFLADYWIWDLEPYGYRLTNLLLHVANAGLLFLLLCRLLPKLLGADDARGGGADAGRRTPILALLVALCWLVHPVHSAAVAYISGRADSLAMCFALLAWLAYERGNAAMNRGGIGGFSVGWFAGGFLALLLALCSKEIAAIWLALFGLYLLLGKPAPTLRCRALAFACALLALACYAGLRQLPVPIEGGFVPPPPPLPPKFVLMARSLGDYAGLLLWPVRLFMERQVFPAYGQTPSAADQFHYHALFVTGVVTLALLAAGAFWWRAPGQTLRRFGAAWFLLAWLPVSNLWLLNASVAEHWLYLPSIGFLLFLAGCAVGLRSLSPVQVHRFWPIAPPAIAIALTLLAVRTHLRSMDWRDDLTFYRQTLKAGSGSPRIRAMLAQALLKRARADEAETMLRALSVEYPKYGSARLNLAAALIHQRRHDEAAELLHRLRDSDAPADRVMLPSVWGNLLLLPAETADPQGALAGLGDAIIHQPQAWSLIDAKSRLLRQLGRAEEAQAAVAHYRAARPWHYPATMLLAALTEERGELARAEELYLAAGRLDVHEVASRRARALLRLRENRPEAACELAREAVRRQPGQAQNYVFLAQICTHLDLPHEAAAAVSQAKFLQSRTAP